MQHALSSHDIKALRISLASPEQIRSWSSGEITKAETLNYRTLKPEVDGLFCERIFGPTKNWTCSCGKYKRYKHKGKICEKCGVQVMSSYSRRTRMGHIELAAPVCHVWYTRGMPSRIGLLLNLTPGALNKVLGCMRYIVMDIDEKARLDEIQRLEKEIAQLQSAESVSKQATVARVEQGCADAMLVPARSTALVEQQSPERALNVSSILQDLKLLAGLQADAYQGTQARAESEKTLPAELYEDNEPSFFINGQQEVLDANTACERIRHCQRVKKLLSEVLPLKPLEIEQYRLLREECSHVLRMGTGAEAIETLLTALDLDRLSNSLRREIHDHDGASRTRAIKRLKVVEALRRSHTRPEWMVLHTIPVLPPDLRPALALTGGRFASSDVNELYCRILQRNDRLKHFIAMGAPELMILREKQALQAACDALFDNMHSPRPLLGPRRQPLRSLSDSLNGKEGRFRRHLLGKRVDYSGRSVISVGLNLEMQQCGLPKKIALELFKPFIIYKLQAYKIVQTPRQAKRAVERQHPAVWDILEEVMHNRVVLLNRAPTLHRLSIQAFEPVLVEGNAIRLHPQVCSAFNADFDGDQMAVHLPLSAAAQEEARTLMLSTHNLLSPASGEPTISVSQEQVLGCFYLTQERPHKKGEGHTFTDSDEALMAYAHGVIDLQAGISVRMNTETIFEQPPPAAPISLPKGALLQTTVGRLIFNAVLPDRLQYRNYAMKKDALRQLVFECIKVCGAERAAVMANAIKLLGFDHATKAGISFSIKDVQVPPQKQEILAQADRHIAELREEWRSGMITREELYLQSIEIWKEATDQIAAHVQEVLNPFGSVATIANSGATKAKLQQIRQLSGMRGLMASPSGAIIETPVRGNFLQGLSVAEYFISSHGARKSMMDRSLNTAQSGYLTIQLVNAAQDVIITEQDCGAQEGLLILERDSAYMGLPDSSSRLIGRILAEALPTIGLAVGDELHEEAIKKIVEAKIPHVSVRSVLTCQASRGVCQKCYGWDLSTRSLVAPGVAIGIIAAQSIGEPGTQLTMRTFHSGGIAGGQGDITQGIPRVKELFGVRVPKVQAAVSEIGGTVTVTKDEETGGHVVRVTADDASSDVDQRSAYTYTLPPGRGLVVSSGQRIHAYDPITTGDRNPQAIFKHQGSAHLARYLLKEAQRVYRTTGAYIHDKHFEIIIRQMLRYVRVETSGDTDFLPGDLIDRFTYGDRNMQVFAQGGEPASAHVVLLGLVYATLAAESWLAAASFQQTNRILTDAALEGRVDYLRGLKENVILGKRIPAGTGILPYVPPARKPSGQRGRGRPRKR